MAFGKQRESDFVIVLLTTALFIVPAITTESVDCNGKAFHCFNSTHFKICVDFGGVSKTVDDFLIPCPPMTVCIDNNYFECEYQLSITSATVPVQSDVTNELFRTTVSSPWELFEVTTLHPISNHEKSIELLDNSNITPEISQTVGTEAIDIDNNTTVNDVKKKAITDKNQMTISILSGSEKNSNSTPTHSIVNNQTVITTTKEENNGLSTNDNTLSASLVTDTITVENDVTTESAISNDLFNTVITTVLNKIDTNFTSTTFNTMITESSKINDLVEEQTTEAMTTDMYKVTIPFSFIENADNISKTSHFVEKTDDLGLNSSLRDPTENYKISANDTNVYSTRHVLHTSTNNTDLSSLLADTAEKYLGTESSVSPSSVVNNYYDDLSTTTMMTENLTNADNLEGFLTKVNSQLASDLNLASTEHGPTAGNAKAPSENITNYENTDIKATVTSEPQSSTQYEIVLNDENIPTTAATNTNVMKNRDKINHYSLVENSTHSNMMDEISPYSFNEDFIQEDLLSTRTENTSSKNFSIKISQNDFINVEVTLSDVIRPVNNTDSHTNKRVTDLYETTTQSLYIKDLNNKNNANLLTDTKPYFTLSNVSITNVENNVNLSPDVSFTTISNLYQNYTTESDVTTIINDFHTNDVNTRDTHKADNVPIHVNNLPTLLNSDLLFSAGYDNKSDFTTAAKVALKNTVEKITTKESSSSSLPRSENFNNELFETITKSTLSTNITTKSSNLNLSTINKNGFLNTDVANNTSNKITGNLILEHESNTNKDFINDVTIPLPRISDPTSSTNYSDEINITTIAINDPIGKLSIKGKNNLSLPASTESEFLTENISILYITTESYGADRTQDLTSITHSISPKIDVSSQYHPTTHNNEFYTSALDMSILTSTTESYVVNMQQKTKMNETFSNAFNSNTTNDIHGTTQVYNKDNNDSETTPIFTTSFPSESIVTQDVQDQITSNNIDFPNTQESPISIIVNTDKSLNTLTAELSRNEVNLTDLSNTLSESKVTQDVRDQITITKGLPNVQDLPLFTIVNTEKLLNTTENKLSTNEVNLPEPYKNLSESKFTDDIHYHIINSTIDLSNIQESPLSTSINTEKLLNITASELSRNEANLTEPFRNLSNSKVTHDVYGLSIVNTEKLFNNTANELSRNEDNITEPSKAVSKSKITYDAHSQATITSKDLPNTQKPPLTAVTNWETLFNEKVNELSRKVNLTEPSKNLLESKVTHDVHAQNIITNTDLQESPLSTIVKKEKLLNATASKLSRNEVNLTEPSKILSETKVTQDVHDQNIITKGLPNVQDLPLSTIVNTEKLLNTTENKLSINKVNLSEPYRNVSESKFTHDIHNHIINSTTDLSNIQESPLSTFINTEKLLNITGSELSRNEANLTEPSQNLSNSKVTHDVYGLTTITITNLPNVPNQPQAKIVKTETLFNVTANDPSRNIANVIAPSQHLSESKVTYDVLTITNTDLPSIRESPLSTIVKLNTEKLLNTTDIELLRNKVNLTETYINLSESKVAQNEIIVSDTDLPNKQESTTENLFNTTENALSINEIILTEPSNTLSDSIRAHDVHDQITIINSGLPNILESPLSTIINMGTLHYTAANELSRNDSYDKNLTSQNNLEYLIHTFNASTKGNLFPSREDEEQTTNVINVVTATLAITPWDAVKNSSISEVIVNNGYTTTESQNRSATVTNVFDDLTLSYIKDGMVENSKLEKENIEKMTQANQSMNTKDINSNTFKNYSYGGGALDNIYDSTSIRNIVTENSIYQTYQYNKTNNVTKTPIINTNNLTINQIINSLEANDMASTSAININSNQTNKYQKPNQANKTSIYIASTNDTNSINILSVTTDNLIKTSSNIDFSISSSIKSNQFNMRPLQATTNAPPSTASVKNMFLDSKGTTPFVSKVQYDQGTIYASNTMKPNIVPSNESFFPLKSNLKIGNVNSTKEDVAKVNLEINNSKINEAGKKSTVSEAGIVKEEKELPINNKLSESTEADKDINRFENNSEVISNINYVNNAAESENKSSHKHLPEIINKVIKTTKEESTRSDLGKPTGLIIQKETVISKPLLTLQNSSLNYTNESTKLHTKHNNDLSNSTMQINITRLISEENIIGNLHKDNGTLQTLKIKTLNVGNKGLVQSNLKYTQFTNTGKDSQSNNFTEHQKSVKNVNNKNNNIDMKNSSLNIVNKIQPQYSAPVNKSMIFNRTLNFTTYSNYNTKSAEKINSYEINQNKTKLDVKHKAENKQISNKPVQTNVNKETSRKEQTNKTVGKNKLPKYEEIIKSKFICNHRHRGKYSDKNDCQNFYICIGRDEPIFGKCPNNTVFSEISKQCTRNLSHCIRNNQFLCTSAGRYIDIFSDEFYYICAKKAERYVRFKLKCQRGYHLDKSEIKCILDSLNGSISNEDSSKTDSEKSTTESKSKEDRRTEYKKQKADFECKKEGMFIYPDDCRKYYHCTKRGKSEFRRKIRKCDSDEVFNDKRRKCVDEDSYECKE